jgi:hypothetical protein
MTSTPAGRFVRPRLHQSYHATGSGTVGRREERPRVNT